MQQHNVGVHDVWHGACEDVLDKATVRPCSVVLTDPPYHFNTYIRRMEEGSKYDPVSEGKWAADQMTLTLAWLIFAHKWLTPDALLWIFGNYAHAGFYPRAARWTGYKWFGSFPCAGDDGLTILGMPEAYMRPEAAHVMNVVQANNRYGQGKPVEVLRKLLTVSPAGDVLDPFAGSGTTALAALAEGRGSVSIETDAPRIEQIMTALESAISGVVSSTIE